MRDKLLEIKNLKKYFYKKKSFFSKEPIVTKAVDGISFDIYQNETLGLIGESGCGKSTVGRTITRLYSPTEGQIIYKGKDLSHLSQKELMPYRSKMQMIFQDPYASLNPRMTVMDIVREPLTIHGDYKGERQMKERVYELLAKVGMLREHANRYPHEFSGGQRQRIGIARSLAVNPEFIICDEPISALDVSIQAQVVNMLEDLQREMNLTYLFIAHDLSMVRHISHRLGVMYLGHLVELGESEEIYRNHKHPYTEALLSAIPIPDPDVAKKTEPIILEGDVPSPINPPSGCPFRTRCVYSFKRCSVEKPELVDIGNQHWVACHKIIGEEKKHV